MAERYLSEDDYRRLRTMADLYVEELPESFVGSTPEGQTQLDNIVESLSLEAVALRGIKQTVPEEAVDD